jgi:hypothetical protein
MPDDVLGKTIVIALLLGVWGCSMQPAPAYHPPTPTEIIWKAESKEGKVVQEELQADLMGLVGEICDSKLLAALELEDNSVYLVRFEESGRKCGLEIIFVAPGAPGRTYQQKTSSIVRNYLPPVIELIGRHPALTDNEKLDCFVVTFRWIAPRTPGTSYRSVPVVRVDPATGTITGGSRSVPDLRSLRGSEVYDEVALDIPRLVMKKLASGEIDMADLDEYTATAGPRKRM